MKLTIDQAIEIGKKYELTLDQIGYLESRASNRRYPLLPLPPLLKSDLHIRKLIDNKDGIIAGNWRKWKESITNQTINFRSSDLLLTIFRKVSAILVTNDFEGKAAEKAGEDFANNRDLQTLFTIWLNLWPTRGSKNTGWETLYGLKYNNNVILRSYSVEKVKFFKNMARRTDIDVTILMLGSYLFVKSFIRNGVAYIPKMERFMEEWEAWYDAAETIARDNQTENDLITVFAHSSEIAPQKTKAQIDGHVQEGHFNIG